MLASTMIEILAQLRADIRKVPPEMRCNPEMARLLGAVNFHATSLGIQVAQLAREEDRANAERDARAAAIETGAVAVLPKRRAA